IETIVSKALEKDRERRYESAAALAADVRRFLGDEPILARPPSAAYQLRKFARRNKALVGGALAVLVALVVGSAGVTVQYVRAERARGRAGAARRAAGARRGEAEQARDAARLAQDGERRERERAQRQERSAQQMNNLLMR